MTLKSLDQFGLHHGTDKASSGHDVLRHYEQSMEQWREDAFLLVEIGGLRGASLRTWADYFPKASIVCLDINPEVAVHASDRIAVEIGSSADVKFLDAMVEKHGRPRIVLDDGSHRWDHQRIAFQCLFPQVHAGGIYIVEDMHSNFEGKFAGADLLPFSEILKLFSDFMHMRGTARAEFLKQSSPRMVKLVREIDYIKHVRRSVIVGKISTTLDDDPA